MTALEEMDEMQYDYLLKFRKYNELIDFIRYPYTLTTTVKDDVEITDISNEIITLTKKNINKNHRNKFNIKRKR